MIRRIVHVSVESTRIVEGLPEPILVPKGKFLRLSVTRLD